MTPQDWPAPKDCDNCRPIFELAKHFGMETEGKPLFRWGCPYHDPMVKRALFPEFESEEK